MQQPPKNGGISVKHPRVRSSYFMPACLTNNSDEDNKIYSSIHFTGLSPTAFIDKPHFRPELFTRANLCKMKNYAANYNLLSLHGLRNTENSFIKVF